jgi:WD40 repeat protein/mono/diheme cytochrome c family protein
MSRLPLPCLVTVLALSAQTFGRADDPKPKDAASVPDAKAGAAKTGTVSFIKDVAPILVQNCIACHNSKKSESKYTMTTFALLAKGGQQGEGITLEAGDPDASRFVELLRPDGEPRMPFKQDPLPPEKIALIERWVEQGAKYDGGDPTEDWTLALRRATPIVIPESYLVTVPITALAFSPDGTKVATSGFHEVNLWKVANGTLDRRLQGLAERVYDIAYSPDGKWLATASGDPGQFGSVKLWVAEPDGGGKPVRDLLETNDSVLAVAFSPDSKFVAAGGADRAVRVWEVASGKLVALIEDHADWVTDLAFSPDGKRIATASRDKTCKVFDVEKKESLVTFPGHAQTVYAVAFSPDGKSVASGGEDNQIRVWNPGDDGKQVRQTGGFGGPIFRLQYTPDGKSLVACSSDKTVRVFTASGGSQERSLAGHADWIYAFALSPDGKTLCSGSWDGEVRLWSLADGKPLRTIIAAPGFKPATTVQASTK